MNYIPHGDGPTRSRPPKNICGLCNCPVIVTVVGKGTWGHSVDSRGKIARYAHADCIYGLEPPDTAGGAA